jgi:hypothetical protein
MPNEEFLPFAIDVLKSHEGKTITLPLRGRSMRPFLEDERGDRALLQVAPVYKKGDVVLAEIKPRRFVLHRIVDISGNKVTLRGDGNLACEHCTISDVRAKAIAFYRKGSDKADMTDGWRWRIYSALWTRLLPIRRYLLFIYNHLH